MKDKQLLRGMIAVLATVALALPAGAGIVWQADFESYSAGNNVALNATGDDDTFTSFQGSGSGLTPSLTVVDASAYGLNMAGKLSAIPTTTTKQVWLNQASAGSYGDGTFLALSFDAVRPSDTTPAQNILATFATADGTRATSGFITLLDNQFTGSTKKGRVTLVMNLTGADVALPGTLGMLADGMVAMYGKEATSGLYVGLATTTISDANTITGFIIDQPIPANTANIYHLFDNMVFVDSASDTIGGTNVLELDFGTAVVPEPTTIGMLGVGALVAILRRRLMR